jgi:hypothetical protein
MFRHLLDHHQAYYKENKVLELRRLNMDIYFMRKVLQSSACFLIIVCSADFPTLNLEAVWPSEMSVNFYQITFCQFPKDSTFNLY